MKFIKLSILITSICSVIIFSGCSNEVYQAKALRAKFPESEIVKIPNEQAYFIIRKTDGSIWYAYCPGHAEKSSVFDELELLPAKK